MKLMGKIRTFMGGRFVFNAGLDFLKCTFFAIPLGFLIKSFAYKYLNVTLDQKAMLTLCIILTCAISLYEILLNAFFKFKKQLYEDMDRVKAIEVLEKHNLKVAMYFTDLPKYSSNNKTDTYIDNREIDECVEAYITLRNQGRPFLIANSQNEVMGKLYFVGRHGKYDHSKYKMVLKKL